MKTSTYYYKTKILQSGSKLLYGKDCLPYALNDCVVLTQAKGGEKDILNLLDENIFCNANLYNKVFKPIFTAEPELDFLEYVNSLFKDTLKDSKEERDEVYSVSAGLLCAKFTAVASAYILNYSTKINKEKMLSSYALAEDKNDAINAIATQFKGELVALVKALCDKANISSVCSLEDFKCSLTVAFNAKKSGDVICLWAGDINAYVWNERGLKVINSKNENSVCFNGDCSLTGKALCVQNSTFALLGATDGFYGCDLFASPFDFEYLFISTLAKNNDSNKFLKGINEAFKVIGKIKQSGAFAISYGKYQNYSNLQNTAFSRLVNIDDSILSLLPDILEVDYVSAYESAVNRVISALLHSDKVILNQEIRNKVYAKLLNDSFPPFLKAVLKTVDSLKAKSCAPLNIKNASAEEIIKVYTLQTKEEQEGIFAKNRSEIFSFIISNWSAGACLKDLKFNYALSKMGEPITSGDEVKDNQMEFYLLLQQGIIRAEKGVITDGNESMPVSDEVSAKINCFKEYFRANFLRRQLKTRILALANDYVKDYYSLKLGEDFALEILNEMGDRILEIKDKELALRYERYKTMTDKLKLRNKIYGDYEKDYLSLV